MGDRQRARVALFIGILIVGAALDPFLDAGEEQGLTPSEWDSGRAAAFAANAIVVVGIAPVIEELTYRGLGFSLLRPYGEAAAIVGVGRRVRPRPRPGRGAADPRALRNGPRIPPQPHGERLPADPPPRRVQRLRTGGLGGGLAGFRLAVVFLDGELVGRDVVEELAELVHDLLLVDLLALELDG